MTIIKKEANAFPTASSAASPAASPNRDIAETLMDVRVKITVEIGRTRLPLADILKLKSGEMLALNSGANDPLKIFVNDMLFAYGEAVIVNGKVGVRVTEVIARSKSAQDDVKRSA